MVAQTALGGTRRHHCVGACCGIQTLARLPDGYVADADKGYKGLAAQVETVTLCGPITGEIQTVARLRVQTPFKKPKGGELTDEQKRSIVR